MSVSESATPRDRLAPCAHWKVLDWGQFTAGDLDDISPLRRAFRLPDDVAKDDPLAGGGRLCCGQPIHRVSDRTAGLDGVAPLGGGVSELSFGRREKFRRRKSIEAQHRSAERG
jgi:hypothetical protein